MEDSSQDPEVVLAQFNRLTNELLRGTMNRNTFRAWEIELLLDIESCNLAPAARREVLRRYQKAMGRRFESGETRLIKLSEFLDRKRPRKPREGGEPHAAGSAAPGPEPRRDRVE
jgi:hypothetical protein